MTGTLLKHRISGVRNKKQTNQLSEMITDTAQSLTDTTHNQHAELVELLSGIAAKPDGMSQLESLSRQIAGMPVPKDVDLSPLVQAIKDIPVVDVTPQLKRIEASVGSIRTPDNKTQLTRIEQEVTKKRIHTFDVIRDPIDGQINKIVVTES